MPAQMLPKKNDLHPIESRAIKSLYEPYYGKTITGFANKDAWRHVVTGVTLKHGDTKPNFRHWIAGKTSCYRIRLNPKLRNGKGGLEVSPYYKSLGHTSLHEDAKKYREHNQLSPLPPHQSWTYFEPTDASYKPQYFNPSTTLLKNEVIGMRVSLKETHINRIILKDTGTYYLGTYGFLTQSAANDELKNIIQDGRWACSLSELKRKFNSNEYKYNEVMVRASWICDGSSQLVIYPPYATTGKLRAMLYRYDLENHLREHQSIYEKEPFFWKENYKVPISYWSNSSPALFTFAEQEKELQKPSTDFRECLLKASIYYMRGEEIPKRLSLELALYELFTSNDLSAKRVFIETHLQLLNWMTRSHEAFYDYLKNSLKIPQLHDNLVQRLDRSSNIGPDVNIPDQSMEHLTPEELTELFSLCRENQRPLQWFLIQKKASFDTLINWLASKKDIRPLQAALFTENYAGENLLRASMRNEFELCIRTFKNIDIKHHKRLFKEQDIQKCNILMHAAKVHPKHVLPLLEIIKSFEEKTMATVLSACDIDGCNALYLAKGPEKRQIFNAIVEGLSLENQFIIFNQYRPINLINLCASEQEKPIVYKAELGLLICEMASYHPSLSEQLKTIFKSENTLENIASQIAIHTNLALKKDGSIRKGTTASEVLKQILIMCTVIGLCYKLYQAANHYKNGRSLFFQSPMEKKIDLILEINKRVYPQGHSGNNFPEIREASLLLGHEHGLR